MAVLGIFCVIVKVLGAAEVTPEMASRAVKNWRATRDVFGCRFGGQVAAARRCEFGEAKFNVVQLEGGGFVVTSADTEVRPILFFCDGEDLDEDPRNPLFALLKQDMRRAAASNRKGRATLASIAPAGGGADAEEGTSRHVNERQWAELLTEASVARLSAIRTPSDIRVDKLVQSAWSQSTVGSSGWFSSKKNVYNYYTPNNYVCGCVATAMAQIMRYHQFPTASLPQFSNPYCSVGGTDTELTSMGGTYDWANMPLSPSSSITTAQQQAIGKLCYDAGVAVSMSYGKDGSGSNVYLVPHAFVNRFGYRGAMGALWSDGNSSVSLERTRRVMITNFDAGLPIEIGISGDGGHAIVADGYGYSSGSFCCHLNFGWAGSDDGWYIPPDLGDYNLIDEIAYNIFPTQDPTCAIVSGRILSSSGAVASGVTVKAVRSGSTSATATTNSKGIFALFVKPGTYSIKAESGISLATATATPTALKSLSPVIENGNPTGSYWTGNRNAEICNVHVGDMQLVDQTPIAQIGSTRYLSLQAACAAAQAGQTVTLLANAVETAVTVTKGMTIDFAGYTLSGTLFAQNNTSGQTLTLKNGTISGASDSFDGASGTTTTYPDGAVRFENMTMKGAVWSDEHPLTFASGTYEGTISIGTTSATILDGKYANLAHTGAGLFVVTGGAFANSFAGLVSPPSGYSLVCAGTDPVYPWVLGHVVARIGGDGYQTLAAACAAALVGQTVELVSDVDESEILVMRGCTIDLGGHAFAGHFVCTNAISTTVAFTNGRLTGEISVVGRGAASVSNACTVAMLHGESAGMLRVDGGTATTILQENSGKVILTSGTIGQATGASFTMSGGLADVVSMTGAVVVSGGTVTSLTSGGSVKLTGGTFGNMTVAGTALSTMTDVVVDRLVHTGTGRVTVNGGSYRSFTTTGTGAVVLRGGRYGAPVTGGNVTLAEGTRWVRDGQDAACPWILSDQIACIGDRFFQTLAEACAAASAGETVSLLDDDDESEVLVKNKCVIDFCGNVFSGTLVCSNAISTTVALVNGTLTGEVSVVGRGAVSVSNACTVAMLHGRSAGMLRVDGGTATTVAQDDTGKIILMTGQIGQATGASFTMNDGAAGRVSMTGAVVVSGGTVDTLAGGGSVKLTGGTFRTLTVAGSALSTMTDAEVGTLVHTGTGRVTVNGGLFGSFTTAGNGAVSIRGGRYGERVEGANVSLAEGFYWYKDDKDEGYPWRLTTIRPSERTATCILLR